MITKANGRIPRRVDRLPPFPEGWYFIATRDTLRKDKLIEKTWMGEEIVAWCDDEGRVCVADAFCPHLGSHLGPTAGGTIRDGCLVCPFHGFTFDTTGQCVATPNAPAPRAAKLKLYETREILGMVFAWYGIGGRAPQWDLPDEPPTGADWSGLRSATLRFRGHPQETTENSVDMAHLRYVHGYESVSRVGEITIDGAYLRGSFKFKARIGAGRFLSTTFDVSAVAHIFGLGYSQVDFEEHSTGYRSRLWILSTPIDGTSVAMTIASQVGGMERPKGVGFGLRLLPLSVRLDLMNRLTLRMETGYVKEDVLIWSRKRYLTHPRLNGADGEILAYRRYCEQFYGDRDEDRGRMGGRLIARQI